MRGTVERRLGSGARRGWRAFAAALACLATAGGQNIGVLGEEQCAELAGESWKGSWEHGQKTGFSQLSHAIEDRDGERVFVIRNVTHTFATEREPASVWAEECEFDLGAPQLLRRATYRQPRSDPISDSLTVVVRSKAIKPRGPTWRISSFVGPRGFDPASSPVKEERRSDEIDLGDYPLARHLAYRVWFRNGPQDGESRWFDVLASSGRTQLGVAVRKVIDLAPPYPPARIYHCQQHTYRFFLDADGSAIGGEADRSQVWPETRLTAATCFGPDRLPGRSAGVSRPFGAVEGRPLVELETDARWAPVFAASPAQSVRLSDDGAKCLISIRTGAGAEAAPSDGDRASLTRADGRIDSDHGDVAAAARKHAAGADDLAKVIALAAWISKRIGLDPLWPGFHASQVLADKKGGVEGRVLLFVAMARAAGIPARAVTGFVHLDDGAGRFLRRPWAEAWVPPGRWVAIEPWSGEVGSGLLRIACQPVSDEFLAGIGPADRIVFTPR